jgi:hypothetical protein
MGAHGDCMVCLHGGGVHLAAPRGLLLFWLHLKTCRHLHSPCWGVSMQLQQWGRQQHLAPPLLDRLRLRRALNLMHQQR